MSPLVPPVVEPREFPIGSLVRMLQPSDALVDILRYEGVLPDNGRPVARVVGVWRISETLSLKIDGASGGRISNAYAAPCAKQLAFVAGELERLTLEACGRLVRADRVADDAIGAQQRLWKSDRAGRRVRGRAVAVANRSRSRALAELVALVQRADVPPVVAHHFALIGPTYHDAAAAAIRAGRFAPGVPA